MNISYVPFRLRSRVIDHIYSSWKCRNHQWVSPSPYISYSVTQQAHPIASTSYMSSLHSYWLSDSSAWISPTHAYFPQASRLILLRLISDLLLKTVQCAPIAFIVKPNHLTWLKRTFMVWLLLHFPILWITMPQATLKHSTALPYLLIPNLSLDSSLNVPSGGLEDIHQIS